MISPYLHFDVNLIFAQQRCHLSALWTRYRYGGRVVQYTNLMRWCIICTLQSFINTNSEQNLNQTVLNKVLGLIRGHFVMVMPIHTLLITALKLTELPLLLKILLSKNLPYVFLFFFSFSGCSFLLRCNNIWIHIVFGHWFSKSKVEIEWRI